MNEDRPGGSSFGSPIACDLNALSAAERERRGSLAAKIHGAVTGRHELADGYALRVAQGKVSAAELDDWIALEGRCCPFLRFALVPDGDALWLQLTGRAGVKEFLKSEMGA